MTGSIVATLTDLQQHMKQGSKPTQQAVYVSKTLGYQRGIGPAALYIRDPFL